METTSDNSVILQNLNLVNPDGEQEQHYEWSTELMRRILGSMLVDQDFLLQCSNLIKPAYFKENAHQFICRSILNYHDKYKGQPDRGIIQAEIEERLSENNNKYYYLAELDTICESYEPGLEKREYFLDKITEFAKTQSLRVAYNKTLDLFNDKGKANKWDQIRTILEEALKVERNIDLGLDYFESIEARYERMRRAIEMKEFFSSGFPSIDEALGGGLCRGELGAFAGMCFAKNTKVLMYDGTTKKVQDVKVGDLLMGNDSTPRRVLKLAHGIDNMYRVTPVKGEPYVVNEGHILSLKASVNGKIWSRRNGKNSSSSIWHTHPRRMGNSNIYNMSVVELLNQKKWFREKLKGWRTGVEFESKPVRIDPYILGVWLGDGLKQSATITNVDPEVIKSIYDEASARGLVVTKHEENFSIVSEEQRTLPPGKSLSKNTLRNDLRHYGLLYSYATDKGRKHIPHDYKCNSREVRLQILAGLLDTDGSLSKGGFDFTNKNKSVSEGVTYLARSLGLAAYMSKSRKKSQNGTEGTYWRVSISGDCSIIPVRIKKKKAPPRRQVKDVLVTGITVEPVGKGEYFGFEVDGNHLFLLSDFTVTHNSGAGKSICLVEAGVRNLQKRWNVLYISLEISEDKIAERFDSMLTNVPLKSLYYDPFTEDVKNALKEESPDWGRLVIKQFPAGTVDVPIIRAYISQLKLHGFNPDVVVVDYVGEFREMPGIKTHETRGRQVRDLRGLATELQVCIFTAMQINRGGRDAMKEYGYIDMENIAESAAMVRPLDCLWTISQTEVEEKANVGTIFASKHRSGKGRFLFRFSRDPSTLIMNEISPEVYRLKMSKVVDKAAEEAMIEDIAANSWKPNSGAKQKF